MLLRRLFGGLFLLMALLLVHSTIELGIPDFALGIVGFGGAGAFLLWSAPRRAQAVRRIRAAPDPPPTAYSLRSAAFFVVGLCFGIPLVVVDGPEARNYLGALLLPFVAGGVIVSLCLSIRAIEEGRRSPIQYAIAAAALLTVSIPILMILFAR